MSRSHLELLSPVEAIPVSLHEYGSFCLKSDCEHCVLGECKSVDKCPLDDGTDSWRIRMEDDCRRDEYGEPFPADWDFDDVGEESGADDFFVPEPDEFNVSI